MRTGVEVFSGAAGGWALGLSWAGVQITAGCEKDPERANLYADRWGVPVLDDVRTAKAEDFPVRPWLLAGSPPCQDASEINRNGRGVDGDETGLFFDVIDLGARLRPAWITLENVSGLRTRGADRVLLGLEEVGYSARTIVVGSDLAGKDHERARCFIIASDTARPQRRPARQPRPANARPPARRRMFGGPPDLRGGLWHVRPETIGRHLRAYAGVPDRVAERARCAYGDSLDPIFPYIIARALISWEERNG